MGEAAPYCRMEGFLLHNAFEHDSLFRGSLASVVPQARLLCCLAPRLAAQVQVRYTLTAAQQRKIPLASALPIHAGLPRTWYSK